MSEQLVRPEHLTEQEQEWLRRWRDKEEQPAESERVELLREEVVPVEVVGEVITAWLEGEMEPGPVVDEARRRLLTLPVLTGFFTTHYDGLVNEFYVLRSRDEGEEFGFAKTYEGDSIVEEFAWEQPGRSSLAFPHGEWVEWEEGTTLNEALRNGADDYYLFEGLD